MVENLWRRRLLAASKSTESGLIASILVLLGLIFLLAPSDSFFTIPSQRSLFQQIARFTGYWRSARPW